MKRTSSAPSRSPVRTFSPTSSHETDTPSSEESALHIKGLPDEAVIALRDMALRANDYRMLNGLLTARPDLPFHLHMNVNMNPALFCTLIDALPDDETSPAIELSGSLPDGVPLEALDLLFTHPTLHTLSLTELMLNDEELQSIVSAVRATPSELVSLTFSDDDECLLEPALTTLITELAQLQTLTLGVCSMGSSALNREDPECKALARCLVDKPLKELVLKGFSPFMAHICMAWKPDDQPQWEKLTVDLVGMTPQDEADVGQLSVFLFRCIGNPALRTLSLQQFYVDDGDPDNNVLGCPACCPSARELVESTSDALIQRTEPLHLELGSSDALALEMLMGSIARRPGVRCVRTLELSCRSTPASLQQIPGGKPPFERFLQGLAACLSALPKLDSLAVTIDVQVDPDSPGIGAPVDGVTNVPGAARLSALALGPVVQALNASKLTALSLSGALLEPAPDLLQPCLQQVHARAAHLNLQIRALNLDMGFMLPPLHLPPELGSIIARNVDPDGNGRELVSQMPALNRTELLKFVDRYNLLARALDQQQPDATPSVPDHPLTGLSVEIRQRMQASAEKDQADGATGLR